MAEARALETQLDAGKRTIHEQMVQDLGNIMIINMITNKSNKE